MKDYHSYELLNKILSKFLLSRLIPNEDEIQQKMWVQWGSILATYRLQESLWLNGEILWNIAIKFGIPTSKFN
jgi:hypothetical protein